MSETSSFSGFQRYFVIASVIEFHRLVEIPAHFFYIYTMGRFGRRITQCGGLLICGFACLAAGLVPSGNRGRISNEYPRISSRFFGKTL